MMCQLNSVCMKIANEVGEEQHDVMLIGFVASMQES